MAILLQRILNLSRAIELIKVLGSRLVLIDLKSYLFKLEFDIFLLQVTLILDI